MYASHPVCTSHLLLICSIITLLVIFALNSCYARRTFLTLYLSSFPCSDLLGSLISDLSHSLLTVFVLVLIHESILQCNTLFPKKNFYQRKHDTLKKKCNPVVCCFILKKPVISLTNYSDLNLPVLCASIATSTAATSATTIASTGQTFQLSGSPVTMAGKVITKLPLPANSKIVAVNVPSTQGGRAKGTE